MNQLKARDLRLAVIAALAQRSAAGMGRTALMKLTYFLQTLRDVPLGYSFRLYTYGPFDSQVLDDLKVAEMMGVVRSTAFSYPGGYGYEIRSGDHADRVADRARDELAVCEGALDWVVKEFGDRSAIDLEMASTIVYVDRAAAGIDEQLSIAQIATRVEEIKPRLERARIEAETARLKEKDLLIATA
jgi:uncharacterized protein